MKNHFTEALRQINGAPEDLLGATALFYALRCEWYVFPLEPGTKRPFRGSRGFYDATLDPQQIAQWWTACPQANIGIDCGRSQLLVIDIDPRNGGNSTWKNWLDQNPNIATLLTQRALTVATPGGGMHVYTAGSTNHDRGRTAIGAGVDIKAAGGYVVAPPSILPHGAYQWR